LKWVLSLWNSQEKWLPLAMDATNIGQNFTVLSIHVLYRGCGIPIAWKIIKGTEKGSWKPYWINLFQLLKNTVPNDWQVIVSADRGLYADWLFKEIVTLNWHPFLRINHQGTYQILGEQEWRGLDSVVPKTDRNFSGSVSCFKSNPLDCTLLARWDEGYQEPWLIVTDLKPKEGKALWYSLRSWIEASYRELKSDGWQWQKTRLREPERAERLWLAMAVATLWTVTMGSDELEDKPQISQVQEKEIDEVKSKSQKKKNPCHLSVFLRGLIHIIADLLCGKAIALQGLFPQSSAIFNTS
jgi:Transposase DDE domain